MQTGVVANFQVPFTHTNANPIVEAHVRVMQAKVTVHMHMKHTAYQTLMQHPHCRLSDPLSAAVRGKQPCFSCKAFYRYKAGCLSWLLLLLLLASCGPSPLTQPDSQWILAGCSSKIKSFWGNKGRRSEPKFITRQLELFSS